MALVYAVTGTLSFIDIAQPLKQALASGKDVFILTGIGMIVVGMAFKLALVPFHLWTADVYQGAPAPVTGFIATVSKGSMMALMVRFFYPVHLHPGDSVYWMFGFIAVLSMFAGNLLALLQNNVKRILAFSSIAHMGYLMVAFLSTGPLAKTAVTFYLVVYFVTTLGAFGVITVLSSPDKEVEALVDYRGLLWKRPWLGGIFIIMLLSLAGIPITAGFMGKFYLVASGVESAQWPLVFTLVLTSTIGLFYYLRVVGVMIIPTPVITADAHLPALSMSGFVILAVLVVFLIILGVLPSTFINLLHLTFL